MILNEIGYLISNFTSLLPIAGGLFFLKRLSSARRYILFFLVFVVLVELSNATMAFYRYGSNLWLINIYTAIEYGFYAFILNKWVKGKFMFRMTFTGSLLFSVFWLGYLLLYHTLNMTFLAADITGSAVIMLLSCFVVTTLSLQTERPVLKDYRFWFSAALFAYFAVNVLISLVRARLMENPNAYEFDAYHIHTVLNISMNLVFTYVLSLREQ